MPFEKERMWWGQKRWSQALSVIGRADRMVVKAIRDGRDSIEAGTIEANLERFENSWDAQHELVDEPAAVIRAGLFAQAVSEFEYALLFLCVDGGWTVRRDRYDWRCVRQDIARSRLRYLSELVGRDLLQGTEIMELQTIRNLIAHTTGETLTIEQGRRDAIKGFLGKWAKGRAQLASVSTAGVILRPAFLGYALAHYDAVMTATVRELTEAANDAILSRTPEVQPEP